MKKLTNKLIKLSVLLVLLIVIFIINNKVTSLFVPKKDLQLFAQLNKNDFSQLNIISATKETILYKKNDQWFLKKDSLEYKADEERVNNIIDNILAFKKEEVVSNNKNKHQELGIGQQLVRFKVKNKTISIYIGKTSGITKNYVRINDENEVYVTEGFTDIFYPDDYRDLSVHFISDENKITSVTINYSGKNTILDKKNNDWFTNDKKLKKERIDFFLNDLKTLKATDIYKDENINNELIEPALIIIAKEGSKEQKADFFTKDKDKYLLKTSNSNHIFEIASGYVESLKKEEKDFSE